MTTALYSSERTGKNLWKCGFQIKLAHTILAVLEKELQPLPPAHHEPHLLYCTMKILNCGFHTAPQRFAELSPGAIQDKGKERSRSPAAAHSIRPAPAHFPSVRQIEVLFSATEMFSQTRQTNASATLLLLSWFEENI